MRIGFTSNHWNDEGGNPAGGCTDGLGFTISWQNGPLGKGTERKAPNGAFVEDVIAACVDRIKYYQNTRFSCERNRNALKHLEAALNELDERTSV